MNNVTLSIKKVAIGVCIAFTLAIIMQIIISCTVTVPKSDFDFVWTEEGGLALSEYRGTSDKVKVPEEINGVPVIELYSDVFSDSTMKEITLPKHLKTIDTYAFRNCKGLTKITIPNSVREIEAHVFSGCTNLKEIHIPDTVEYTDGTAFESTPWWESRDDGVFYIGKNAVAIKGKIPDRVVFKDGTRVISATALKGVNISRLEVPDSVERIGIGVVESTKWYRNHADGIIYIGKVVYGCKGEMPEGTTSRIKDGTRAINDGAFRKEKNLRGITLPNTVVHIGISAFESCEGLEHIDLGGVTTIDNYAFSHCEKLSSITLPNSTESIGIHAFSGTSIIEVSTPKSLKHLSANAFSYCEELKTVCISEGLTALEMGVFRGDTNLKDVYLPSTIKDIDIDVFPAKSITLHSNSNPYLKKYTLSNGLTYIEN